jgi:hypothetical protein
MAASGAQAMIFRIPVKMLMIFACVLPMLMQPARAETHAADVKVARVSLTANGDTLLVQTAPRHSLDGSCSTDFWAYLPVATMANFEALLSMI